MKRLFFTIVSVVILSLATSLAAAAETVWPHEKSDLRPDPDITWGSLPNRLRYAIMKHQDPSEPGRPSRRVSLRFYVRAGSLMERDDQQGLAHFIEHMAFRGTKHFPAGQMIEYFQRLGMGFVSDTNAVTKFDCTVYKLELPENSAAYLDDALTLFRDFADGMLLQDTEISKQRGVVLNEKIASDSIDYRGLVERLRFAMPESLLPRRMPIGTEEVVRNAGHEQLLAFYKKWYVPERMTVVIAGPVDPARVAAKIAEKFGGLKPSLQPVEDPDLGKAATDRGLRTRLQNEPAASCAMIVFENWRAASRRVQTTQSLRDDVLEVMAQVMLNRRMQKLTSGDAPSLLGSQAGSETIARAIEAHRLTILAKTEKWQKALGAGEQELRRAAAFGFSDEEFREIKQTFLQIFENKARRAASRLSPELADGIVASLAAGEVFMHPEGDLIVTRTLLEQISPRDCAAALRRGWCADDTSIFVLGNLPLDKGDEKVAETYVASRRIVVKPPPQATKSEWTYADFGTPGRVAERREVKDLGLTLITFANNVRLNLRPSALEKDTIHVTVSFGGGKLAAPKEKPGLIAFANDMFIGGGLEKQSFDELVRLLSRRSALADFKVGDEFFNLAGNTNRNDLAFEMQLLCAYLTSPGFRGDRIQLVTQRVDTFYNAARHDVSAAIESSLDNFLFQGDVRFAFPERREYKARSMPELKEWLAEARTSSWLEIAVVGDFNPQSAIDSVAATFGALPTRAASRPDYAENRKVRLVAPPCEKRIIVESPIPKAQVIVLWPTTDARHDAAAARQCSVLAAVLCDRVREKVREELGKTYTPAVIANMSDTFTNDGMLLCILPCEAAEARKVGQIVAQLAATLAAEGATADELQRAKKPILSGVERDRGDNDWWMSQLVAAAQSEPQRLDWVRSRRADYEAVDIATVNRLAKAYLSRDRAIIVLAGPDVAGQQTAAR